MNEKEVSPKLSLCGGIVISSWWCETILIMVWGHLSCYFGWSPWMGPTDQCKPLARLLVWRLCSRFDLKAAIDTFYPYFVRKMSLGVFGSTLAAAWVGSGLVANIFRADGPSPRRLCLVAFDNKPLNLSLFFPLHYFPCSPINSFLVKKLL